MEEETLMIGICDDEQEALMNIKNELCRCMKMFEVKEIKVRLFHNPMVMREEINKHKFHLVFLDIEMPEMDGFELAKQICMEKPETKLVFVSSYEDMVFDAYDYMPLWFVRKSLLERDMVRALKKYFHMTARKKISYRLKRGFGYQDVLIKDIRFVESVGHHVIFWMAGEAHYKIYMSMKVVEEDLMKYDFIRVHKSFLVNQKYIKEVGSRSVLLYDGTEVDIGKSRKQQIIEAMGQYERGAY